MVDVVRTLRLEDGGTIKAGIENAKALGKEFDNVANKASKAAESAKSISAASKAESQGYGTSRATVGTGAAGRDFAKESQGLGGLVRVYATFAANLFAVGAAYRALSAAADTANLVEGLNQLGAASGRNLGSLAKQIVATTDNAVSLREAMTATAQASAAGMSSVDILRMSKAAKQASQALGMDMSDALSRLSRGITKLEPELLDELGIFTRVDKASQDYAKSIGKSANSLTDFEKRQAFANAVLKEANDKFGSLNIPVNPYTQLLASLKNVAQTGLDLANNVLGPLVGLLAKSPTGLSFALAGIAAVLLNQAMPAITSFRANLRDAKEEASAKAKDINETFKAYQQANIESLRTRLTDDVKKQGDIAEKAITTARTALNDKTISRFAIVKDAKAGNIADITQETLKATDARAKLAEQEAKSTKITEERRASLLASADGLNKYAAAVRVAQVELTKFNEGADPQNAANAKKVGLGSQGGMLARIAANAQVSVTKSTILSNAAENASILGVKDSWAILRAEVDKNKDSLNGFQRVALLSRGGLTILSTAAMTALNAFSTWAIIIGAVVTALGLANSYFTKTDKQAEAFVSTTNTLKESLDNVDRTLDIMSKRDPLQRLSPNSTMAIATAFSELKDATSANIDTFNKLNTALDNSSFDKFKDNLKKIYSGDTASILAENLSGSINKALDLASQSGDRETLKAKFNKALGISNDSASINTASIEKAAKSQGSYKNITENVLKVETEAAKVRTTSASNLVAFKDALNEAAKSQLAFTNTFLLQDPLAKYAQDLLKVSSATSLLTSNSDEAKKGLLEILSSTDKMASFGPEVANSLLTIKNEFETSTTSTKKYADEISNARKELELLAEKGPKAKYVITTDYRGRASPTLMDAPEKVDARERLVMANKAQSQVKESTVDVRKILTDGLHASFVDGANLLDQSLGNASAKAAITMAKGLLNSLGSGTDAIAANLKLNNAESDIQLRALAVAQEQVLIQTKLNNTFERGNLLAEQAKTPATDREKLETLKISLKANELIKIALAKNSGAAITKLYQAGRDAELDPMGAEAEAARGVAGTQGQLLGIGAKKKEISGQKEANRLASIYSLSVAKMQETEILNANTAKDILASKLETLNISQQLLGFSTVESTVEKNKLESQIRSKEYLTSEATIQAEINGITEAISEKGAKLISQEQVSKLQKLGIAMNTLKAKDAQLDLNAASKGALVIVAAELAARKRLQEVADSYYALEIASQDATVSIEEAKLNRLVTLGAITEDNKNKQIDAIAVTKINNEYTKADVALTVKLNELLANQTRQVNALTISDVNYLKDLQDINNETDRQKTLIDNSRLAIDRQKDTQLTLVDVNKKQTEAQSKYQSFFENSVGTMSDSLIDFAATGKNSFGDMISSMILDLAKLELRMRFTQSISAAGGFSSIFGGLFGKSKSTLPDAGPVTSILDEAAKGRAYDNGIQKFAKGGTFTNSVVTSPTLFKFAKGTGMMGEAGPEAIMPLKRNNNGVLGIQAHSSGSQTSIVVNNFGKEKAEAKESIDSRGNRKIEVTIGDMVAGEISRAGSSAQQSIKTTFGGRPQLIRR